MYGHREILCAYAETNPKYILKGSIEHGWSALGPGHGIPKFNGRRYPHYAWNSKQMAEYGPYESNVVAIGAPFTYLLKMVSDRLSNSQSRNESHSKRILFYSSHGTEVGNPLVDQQIELYSKFFNPARTTVSLYWTEFLNPRIRSMYLSKGFQITCAGFSGTSEKSGLGISNLMNAGSTIGGRHLFLINTLLLINSHSEIVMSGMGTAALYAGLLGKKVHLLPQPLGIVYEWSNRDSISPVTEVQRAKPYYEYIAANIGGEVDSLDFTGQKFQEFANDQLGTADMKSKMEIRNIFKSGNLEIGNSLPVDQLNKALEEFEFIEITTEQT